MKKIKRKGRFIKRRYRLANKARFFLLIGLSAILIAAILIAVIPPATAQEVPEPIPTEQGFDSETILIASAVLENKSLGLVEKTVRMNEAERVAIEVERQKIELELQEQRAQMEREQLLSSSRGSDSRAEAIRILEHIVQAEAGGEPYQGKIAVVNVILNRVESESFPNTIRGVVFQKWQFTPATTGKIWRVEVSDESKRAVRDALEGVRAIGDNGKEIDEDVYFFLNPKLATDRTIIKTQKLVTKIGNHNFYK